MKVQIRRKQTDIQRQADDSVLGQAAFPVVQREPVAEAMQVRAKSDSGEMSPLLGNVQGAMEEGRAAQPRQGGMVVRAKMTIGPPGDKYEQEADRVAKEVVRRMHAPEPGRSTEVGNEGQDVVRRQPAVSIRLMSTVPSADGGVGGIPVSEEFEREVNRARGGGQPLDESFRAKAEPMFGDDLRGVRVHRDGRADGLTRRIRAKAMTIGEDIFFRRGAYDPGSRGGQELLAHEMTHVWQGGKRDGSLVRRWPEETLLVSRPRTQGGEGIKQFDVIYGDSETRGATLDRLGSGPGRLLRTIDDYNDLLGFHHVFMDGGLRGLHRIRRALLDVDRWKEDFGDIFEQRVEYVVDSCCKGVDQKERERLVGQVRSRVVDWFAFLQKNRQYVGLWDLGGEVRLLSWWKTEKKLKPQDISVSSKLKSNRRYGKNFPSHIRGEQGIESVYDKEKKQWIDQKWPTTRGKKEEIAYALRSGGFNYEKDTVKAVDDKAQDRLNEINKFRRRSVQEWIMTAFWRRTSKLGLEFLMGERQELKGGRKVYFNVAGRSALYEAHYLRGLLDAYGEEHDGLVNDNDVRAITLSEFKRARKKRKEEAYVNDNRVWRDGVVFYSEMYNDGYMERERVGAKGIKEEQQEEEEKVMK